VKLPRVTAIAVICMATVTACGSAQSTATLPPLITAAPTPVVVTPAPTPTPTATPTAAPTPRFGLTDTVVVGSSKLTVTKAVINLTAVSKLATTSEMFHTAVGDFRYGGSVATPGSTLRLGQGWNPVGPDHNPVTGDLLGIRASVASGSAEALAGLAVTASSGARGPATLLGSAWSDDGKSVMWFFEIPTGMPGPFWLIFPSGETVDLGTPASS
jgi:hypothetical protein